MHTLFLAAALSLLSAVVRRERKQLLKVARDRRKKIRVAPRRIAASVAFATLFFAGAAFSAGAGNTVVALIDGESSAAETTTTTTTTAAEADQAPDAGLSESATAAALAAGSQSGSASASESTSASAELSAQSRVVGQAVAADRSNRAQAQPESSSRVGASFAESVAQGSGSSKRHVGGKTAAKTAVETARAVRLQGPPVIKAQPRPLRQPVDREPEADEPNVAATVWLYRQLPDPTPPSRRLKSGFAKQLVRISKRNHVDWALALAVLRAEGERGAVPASKQRLADLTKQLARRHSRHEAWASVLSLKGQTTFADRTIALRNLYTAVGVKALVKGFDWAQPHLEKQILDDKRISIYPGGRSDIERHRVNVRVLAMIAYLAEAHGQVTVSCLISGHRLYARPGVVSAHIYGLAADISMLGGVSILGHQQPDNSITEKAVRNILLLPAELQPRQVISLLGMGGPSFPLANHYDHIHVGY
ncbi:MAG TPA: hypothetical protein VH420_01205 [Gaiellaceae bacterium]